MSKTGAERKKIKSSSNEAQFDHVDSKSVSLLPDLDSISAITGSIDITESTLPHDWPDPTGFVPEHQVGVEDPGSELYRIDAVDLYPEGVRIAPDRPV